MNKYFPGVYKLKNRPATINSSPRTQVYGEKIIKIKGKEFRMWDPFRSKLSAGILNGLRNFPFSEDSNVLYLGASSGTTASHLADVCTQGIIYCVEISPRMMRELMYVCKKRKNMIPILADATQPTTYASMISAVDVIYQDVAQPNQAELLLKNARLFKAKKAMIAIKARSIHTERSPKKVCKEEVQKLEDHFKVTENIDIKPFDKDHVLVNLITK
ncbi:MAG: fibrillarin-like rRNA/tRNA 2'-O-methyltransferase [Candidatus Altiarchaeota archaeon]